MRTSVTDAGKDAMDLLCLALETTAAPAGVALLSGDTLLEERRLDDRTRHGVGLLPAVAEIIRAHVESPADIHLLAVSLGPGSFTGIRIGMAAARGFATFSGSRLVGVPTIDALAEEAPREHSRMVAAVDAGRGSVYGAIYDLRSGSPVEEMAPAILPARDLAERIRKPAWVVGSAPARHPGVFEGEGIVIAPGDAYPPRASTIGRLGAAMAADPDGRGNLEPIYLQAPAAKTKWERG